MYFDGYEQHREATINPSLLWEYDITAFDFQLMKDIVVQRVVERGWPTDWYAALNLYGADGIKDIIKGLPYLNDKDMNFVSLIFEIPLAELKCYERKQLHRTHWHS